MSRQSMVDAVVKVPRLESQLAGLLLYGSWLASALTGVGVAWTFLAGHFGIREDAALDGSKIISGGIVCFIALPVLRVVLMLITFLRERNYRFVVISAMVLVILLLAFVLGLSMKAGSGA